MKRNAVLFVVVGLLAGCAGGGRQEGPASPGTRASLASDAQTLRYETTLRYENGWVIYEEPSGTGTSSRGVGGVTSVTLDPYFVRFETSQGVYVIPRERLVRVDPTPLVRGRP